MVGKYSCKTSFSDNQQNANQWVGYAICTIIITVYITESITIKHVLAMEYYGNYIYMEYMYI